MRAFTEERRGRRGERAGADEAGRAKRGEGVASRAKEAAERGQSRRLLGRAFASLQRFYTVHPALVVLGRFRAPEWQS